MKDKTWSHRSKGQHLFAASLRRVRCRYLRRRADEVRKIGGAVCRFCPHIYVGTSFQFGEWQALVKPPCFIRVLWHITTCQNLPAEREMLRVNQRVQPDTGCAVGR